ncbi:uncharacterized protein LOC117171314 isoform X1 [Belonocnema kinseyi]|uniref:uncharacterized protein LOC117171314 isoform X1 n=1 Tax=Belonocnema kinseyi TaxID=2817044 RepID=UPI00143D7041|nr:uncharacterized protein LOC117171314 isoform X1 [Belonocnema kinseyi]
MDPVNKPSNFNGSESSHVKVEGIPPELMHVQVSRIVPQNLLKNCDKWKRSASTAPPWVKTAKNIAAEAVAKILTSPSVKLRAKLATEQMDKLKIMSFKTQVSQSVAAESGGLLTDKSASIKKALIKQAPIIPAPAKPASIKPVTSVMTNQMAVETLAKFFASQSVKTGPIINQTKPKVNRKTTVRAKKRRERKIRMALEDLMLEWKDLSFRGFVETVFSLVDTELS